MSQSQGCVELIEMVQYLQNTEKTEVSDANFIPVTYTNIQLGVSINIVIDEMA